MRWRWCLWGFLALLGKANPMYSLQKVQENSLSYAFCFCLWRKLIGANSPSSPFIWLLALLLAGLWSDKDLPKDTKARGAFKKIKSRDHSLMISLISRKSNFLKKVLTCSPEQTIQQAAAPEWLKTQVSSIVVCGEDLPHLESSPTKIYGPSSCQGNTAWYCHRTSNSTDRFWQGRRDAYLLRFVIWPW